jgi:hypothetical protein
MPRKPKSPPAPETIDEVDLSPRQEQLAATLTDPEADPVVKYLKADREPDETVAAWLARRFCYDLETERQALRQIQDPGELKSATQVMWSIAQTRKAQMDIIARASELEQVKTADATIAAAFRAMMERYPKGESGEKMVGKTRSERHAEWKTSRAIFRS